jgi:hypothetical protein
MCSIVGGCQCLGGTCAFIFRVKLSAVKVAVRLCRQAEVLLVLDRI